MSEPYQLAALQPEALPSSEAVLRVHRLLEQWEIRIAEDSLLVLHDNGDVEPEPEHVRDAATALRRIIAWPTLGTVDYVGPEGMVTVSYFGQGTREPGLQVVLVSAQQRAVDRTNAIPRYQEIGRDLHVHLPAKRTVMRWGLEMNGFRWREEVQRLRNGEVMGTYPLLDLFVE